MTMIRTQVPAAASAAVEALLDAHLLQEVDEDRFRFHDLLRLHARQTLEVEESQPERDTVVQTIAEWYLAAAGQADAVVTPYRRRLPYTSATPPVGLPSFSDREQALGWLERERVNLIAAGRTAMDHGYPALAWHLSDVLWPLFLYRKHYPDRMQVDRLGVAAARAWGNVWAEADMLKRLGRVCTTFRDYQGAERHTRMAILRYQQAGDVRGSLDAQEGLASLYRDSGRHEQAAEMFMQTLAANRERGEDRSTALTLISLGMLLPKLGRSEEAIALLRQARELFATLSDVDPYNEVRVMLGLAGAYLETGDLLRAERAAIDAERHMRDLGSEYGQAEALDLMGQVAQRRGDRDAAQCHHRLAYDIFVRLGSSRASDTRDRLTRLAGARDPVTAADPGVPAATDDADPTPLTQL
jgi:hypothetical protein